MKSLARCTVTAKKTLYFISIIALSACSDRPSSSVTAEVPVVKHVTMGIQVSPAMTLVMVAKKKGYFAAEGLDVELKEFTAGKFALQAFFSGAVDFAVSGEVPVCLATLQGNKTKVVCQVVRNTVNEVRLVAIRDGKETSPANYFKAKKRKLATSFGGGPEFFTYNFLKHFAIPQDMVEIISQKPEDMPAALLSGSVDAIAVFDPFAFIAEQKLGAKAVTFADTTLYSELYVLNAHPEQLEKDPQVIEALLRAFSKSAAFIKTHPEEAKQITQGYTKLDKKVIDGIWNNFIFEPSLTQKLLDCWKDQSAWAKATGKVPAETQLPDFRSIVEERFLKKVDSAAVNL